MSIFREHRHHSDGPAVRNLDTFHSDFLFVVWLVYGQRPPFLTVLPVCKFEPVRTYPIIILKIACLKPLFVNSQKAIFATLAHTGLDSLGGAGTPARVEVGHTGPPVGRRRAISDWRADRPPHRVYPPGKSIFQQPPHPCFLPVGGGKFDLRWNRSC